MVGKIDEEVEGYLHDAANPLEAEVDRLRFKQRSQGGNGGNFCTNAGGCLIFFGG